MFTTELHFFASFLKKMVINWSAPNNVVIRENKLIEKSHYSLKKSEDFWSKPDFFHISIYKYTSTKISPRTPEMVISLSFRNNDTFCCIREAHQ